MYRRFLNDNDYLSVITAEVIRSMSGFKAPAHVDYWEECSDPNIILDGVPAYSQFKTYYRGDKAVYNGLCYECLVENGWKFGAIRMPLVNGWVEVMPSSWIPVEYDLWDVVEYGGAFYTVVSAEDFDANLAPPDSGCWGEIADYDPAYNGYELSDHEYVVYEGRQSISTWYARGNHFLRCL